MADTTFSAGTVIPSTWLNDINDHVYNGLRKDSITPINIKDPTYGGVGDGVTDDTAAFTAAAATGKPIILPYGTYIISTPVTISASMYGMGCDDGQTTITLTGTGRLTVGDEQCEWLNFKMTSSVNSIIYIRCPNSSWTLRKVRIVKTGSPTGQIGLQFYAQANSVYFCNVSEFKTDVNYPIDITGTAPYVFNANKIGGGTSDYCQSFESAISIAGVSATDANEFSFYLETGTNAVSITNGALRQNHFRFVLDAVTNPIASTVTITDTNLWEILDPAAFVASGTYPQNQILVGPASTKVRATQSTAQSMSNAAATIVVYDAEPIDTLSELVNGTGIFTAKNSGHYYVEAGALSASVAWDAGERWEARIYKNGSLYATGDINTAEAATTRQRNAKVSALVAMNGTTDTLDFRIIHNQGGAVLLDSAPTANFLNIYRI